jgi:hypothetical protein
MNFNIRRVARDLARIGAAVSAVIGVTSLRAGRHASAAGIDAGALQVLVPPGTAAQGQPLAAGGSATPFALAPPAGASCQGDSATGGYRVQSYIVPAGVDPGTLTFDSSGPAPQGTGGDLRLPLFSSIGASPFVDQTTAVATTTGGPGLVTGLPSFSFAAFGTDGPTFVPPGIYNVGVACTLGAPSTTQQDRYWNVQMTFAVDRNDVPSGITWTVVATEPPLSVTTTTTAIAVADTIPTSTPAPSATTVPGVVETPTSSSITASTITASTTSTAIRVGSTSSTTSVEAAAAGTGTSSRDTATDSGTSSLAVAIWVVVALALGGTGALVARVVRVRRGEAR